MLVHPDDWDGATMDASNDSLNRRQWPRHESNISRLAVWTDETVSQDAVVLDESLTGLALLVKDGAAFQVDQEVRLAQGERELFATVRHVQAREDGKYRLGFDEWGPSAVKPASLLFLLSKLSHGTVGVEAS
jgi:hypothetical protein